MIRFLSGPTVRTQLVCEFFTDMISGAKEGKLQRSTLPPDLPFLAGPPVYEPVLHPASHSPLRGITGTGLFKATLDLGFLREVAPILVPSGLTLGSTVRRGWKGKGQSVTAAGIGW